MSFIDAVNFDLYSMKKSCVHIIQEDGRLIPFESFNLFYRSSAQQQILHDKRQAFEQLHKPSGA